MTNTLGYYSPEFYANEALILLFKNLGMASRVHLGFDAERRSFNRGQYIDIRKPGTFTVQNAPSTAQDLETETTQLNLSNWKEVKFKVSDKELAYTGERIIEDHIEPAAYEIARDIDEALCSLYTDIPWHADLNATPGSVVTDVTGPRKVLVENAVPMNRPDWLHYMVDPTLEQGLLGLSAFTQHQGSGEAGVAAQRAGSIGMRYGMEFFTNQQVQTHTKGTASTGTLAVDGLTAAGSGTINLDAGTVTGTLVPGDTFVIAGNTQRYAVTNTVTASSNAFTGVTFTPALVAAAADDAVVTVSLDDHTANMAFHRNAFALAMARLPDAIPNELGARVFSVQDPKTGLAIRARLYYVGDSSEVHVALDVLYGVKTLDPNLAVRARG